MFLPSSQFVHVAILTVLLGLPEAAFPFQSQDDEAATGLTSPAPPPLAPQQLASGPVVVRYQNGELTIQAFNSELQDVLRAVSRETGALIDVPANANERVFGEFGPGPAAKVLASLLNGSNFNYVFVARTDNPQYLAQVTLTPRPADVVPNMKSAQAKHKDPNSVVTRLASSPSQPAQPGPAAPQSLPPTPSESGKVPGNDQSFLDALTSELGPEASSIDPQQRRALESMIAQMSAQGSGADTGQSSKQPPRIQRQRRPAQSARIPTTDPETSTE